MSVWVSECLSVCVCVCVCVSAQCFCVSDLVENKSLADVAPAGCRTEVVDQQEQQQHEGNAGRGVDGVDQEHHDGTTNDAQHAGMPGEVTKSGPKKRTQEEDRSDFPESPASNLMKAF